MKYAVQFIADSNYDLKPKLYWFTEDNNGLLAYDSWVFDDISNPRDFKVVL